MNSAGLTLDDEADGDRFRSSVERLCCLLVRIIQLILITYLDINKPCLLSPGIITAAEESLESEVEEPPRFGGISGERILEDVKGFLDPSVMSF